MSGLARPSAYSTSGYFKPGDHMHDVALLFEPTKVNKNVPNTYQGVTKTRDEVKATVTVFKTSEALEKGKPDAILKDVLLVHAGLTGKLENALNDGVPAMPGRLGKARTSSGGTAYTIEELSDANFGLIERYFTSREAAIKAAVADAPDFD